MISDISKLKQKADEYAVQFIESGMVVGLGHGSTAIFAVQRIAELLKRGELKDILGIPSSSVVAKVARDLKIPLTTLNDHPSIDVTIDGADELTENLDMIKGGGGALLREKMVAQASRREIIVADESKLSPVLGTQWPVPVEVIPFGWKSQILYFRSLGARPIHRRNNRGRGVITDQSNIIIDCHFGPIPDPLELSQKICERAGVVEHGLFLGLATDAIIAGIDGIRHMKIENSKR
jgi:ribose 5-phosphate isomerase A